MAIPSYTTKKETSSSIALAVTIAAETVNTTYQHTLQRYIKTSQIKGFRKGFVPPSVIERKFSEDLIGDVQQTLIEEAIQQIFDETAELQPINRPVLQEAGEFHKDKIFTFRVLYDIRPSISLPALEKVPVTKLQVELTDDDIQDRLHEYQEQYATVEDKTDPDVADGDIITADIEELDEHDQGIADTARKDLVFPLKEAPFQLTDALRGLNIGQHVLRSSADEQKRFAVNIKKLQTTSLPAIDDKLAQNISEKFQTLDKLKEDTRLRLRSQIDQQIRELQIQEMIQQLDARLEFEIPQSYIDRLFANRLVQMARQIQIPVQELQDKLNLKELREQLVPDLTKTARHQLILEEIFQKLTIEITDEKVETYIREESPQTDITEELIDRYKEKQIWENIRYQLEKQALNEWLLQYCEKFTINMFSSNREFNKYINNINKA